LQRQSEFLTLRLNFLTKDKNCEEPTFKTGRASSDELLLSDKITKVAVAMGDGIGPEIMKATLTGTESR
jgi:hypothetical protein